MLLRRLKPNNSGNLIFIPIAAVLLWVKSLLSPFVYNFYPGEAAAVLYAPIHSIINQSQLASVAISLVLIIVLGFLMQMLNAQYLFIRIRSKLPGILYVLVIGGFVFMHTSHPVFFGAAFVLLSIYRLFSSFEKKKPYSAIFDSGFFLGLGSLFYYHLVFLYPAFLVGVIILSRETKWRELLILFLGFILPYIFAFTYVFFTNNLEETLAVFVKQIITPVNHFKANFNLYLYMGTLVFYTLVASIDILKQYDHKKVSSRKYFTVYFWIFSCSVLSFAFVPGASTEILLISCIPVTFLISNLFVFMKKRFWGELLFILFIGVIILMQFAEVLINA